MTHKIYISVTDRRSTQQYIDQSGRHHFGFFIFFHGDNPYKALPWDTDDELVRGLGPTGKARMVTYPELVREGLYAKDQREASIAVMQGRMVTTQIDGRDWQLLLPGFFTAGAAEFEVVGPFPALDADYEAHAELVKAVFVRESLG
jgi:hypothetical protein